MLSVRARACSSGLSLSTHMKPGTAQSAIVRRVDPAVGLLLELPAQAGGGDPEADPSPDPDPASTLPPPREMGDKRRGGRKKAARAAKRLAAAAAGGGTALGVGLGGGGGSAPAAAGYAHISNVSDAKVDKLDKVRRGSAAGELCI